MSETEVRVAEANRRNAERLERSYSPANAAALGVRENFLHQRALDRLAADRSE